MESRAPARSYPNDGIRAVPAVSHGMAIGRRGRFLTCLAHRLRAIYRHRSYHWWLIVAILAGYIALEGASPGVIAILKLRSGGAS